MRLIYPIRVFDNWRLQLKLNNLPLINNSYLKNTNNKAYLIIQLPKLNKRSIIDKHIFISEIIRQEKLYYNRCRTAYTKTRSNVTCSNKKPWRQKGTGRARAGSFASPLWRGGGINFGPKPLCKNIHINRKKWKLAFNLLLINKRTNIIVVSLKKNTIINKNLKKHIESQLYFYGINKFKKVLCIFPKNTNLNKELNTNTKFKLTTTNKLTCSDLMFNDYLIIFI